MIGLANDRHIEMMQHTSLRPTPKNPRKHSWFWKRRFLLLSHPIATRKTQKGKPVMARFGGTRTIRFPAAETGIRPVGGELPLVACLCENGTTTNCSGDAIL
jgi:hypothetical protein